MRRVMGSASFCLSLVAVAATALAQVTTEKAPFKLGTFELQGRSFVGLVRADGTVVDVAAANAALEKSHPAGPKVKAPADMKDLIARYEAGGLKERLYAIAGDSAGRPPPTCILSARSRSGRPSSTRTPC